MKTKPVALRPSEAIEMYPALGTTGTLANLRLSKRGPRYFKVGKKVVYRVEDLEAYLFAHPVETFNSVENGKNDRGSA